MASRRTLKAAEAIREVVAMSLLTDLKDPRVKNVTITSVEVSADMRNAKVFFTVRGDEAMENLALHGLKSACGFLQQKCAKRIDTRYTPRLQFAIDEGIKNLIAISDILEREKREKEQDLKKKLLLKEESSGEDSLDDESAGEDSATEESREKNSIDEDLIENFSVDKR